MNIPPIIAVDPGTRSAGLALLYEGQPSLLQQVRFNKTSNPWVDKKKLLPAQAPAPERIYAIVREIFHLSLRHFSKFSMLDDKIVLVYEDPHYTLGFRQERPMEVLYRMVGALDYAARMLDFTPIGYPVREVKAQMTGRHNASKAEVETVLRHEYNLHEATYSPDVWDALAVGTCHLAMLRAEEAIKRKL